MVHIIGGGVQPHVLVAGENARIDVHRSLTGGCKVVVTDGKHPQGYTIEVPPRTAIALALAVLEAAGVPINAELGKRMIAQGGGPVIP